MQHVESTARSKHNITAAVLRDDRSVHVRIGGISRRASGQPDLSQIALGISGLIGLTSKGELWRWNGKPNESHWYVDDSVVGVTSICCLSDGRICAITSQAEALVETATNINAAPSTWTSDLDLTKLLGAQSKRPRLLPGLLRVLVMIAAIVALYFGPIRSIRYAYLQDHTVQYFYTQGINKYWYAHQLGADGTEIPNADAPGPEWLNSLLGCNVFARIHKLEGEQTEIDPVIVAKLRSLRHLSMEGFNYDYENKSPLDISPLANLTNLEHLELRGEIADLSPTSSMKRLQSLSVLWTDITDYSAVKQLPWLTKLTIRGNKIFDASFVGALVNLEELDLNEGARWDSYSPIGHLKGLKKLRICCDRNCPFDSSVFENLSQLEELTIEAIHEPFDVRWVAALPKLQKLRLVSGDAFVEIPTLAPLKVLSQLEYLELPSGTTFDLRLLEALPNLTLESVAIADGSLSENELATEHQLKLSSTNATSLAPFEDRLSNLKSLSIAGTEISDISLIENSKNLTDLNLAGSAVKDLSAIAGLDQLETLNINDTAISDLKNVDLAKSLQFLYLANTRVSDLAPLSTLRELQTVNFAGTPVSDLAPIEHLRQNLTSLDLSNTKVKDLRPIQFMQQLRSLNLVGTPVTDITPLRQIADSLNGLWLPDGKLVRVSKKGLPELWLRHDSQPDD